ncbi:hypothetical protein HHK36_002556 [Tetracentron sinense]|uniref:DPH4 homolog n=1 Tax=Tetracentron sinense TaxID=13715 RepID=A0A834ZMM8_TETSI|nr:hypothetical protein HHK36_002556 [Tetracentron sinense]
MLLGRSSIQKTHYDILSVNEDASYNDIRASYRSAILNSHPDKLRMASEIPDLDQESENRFLKVQKAWEILGDSRSRLVYDSELRASRRDTVNAEDVSFGDMMVEDVGEVLELFYQCRCGNFYSVDSSELGEMGYSLERSGSKILFRTPDALPASFLIPCGSCSLKIRLMIDMDTRLYSKNLGYPLCGSSVLEPVGLTQIPIGRGGEAQSDTTCGASSGAGAGAGGMDV